MTASALVKQSDFRLMQIQAEHGHTIWIYFFWNEANGLFKIGKSNNPSRRCQELSSIMGMELFHLFSFQAPINAEKVIHAFMSDYRHSHEWFKGEEVYQLCECFEEFDIKSGVPNPVLSAEDIEFVLDDWRNSYGRGKSAAPCGNNVDGRK